MFLLDTNVVSELRRAKPHGAVLAWIHGVNDADLNVSAVTLGELQAGLELTLEPDHWPWTTLHLAHRMGLCPLAQSLQPRLLAD